MILSAAELFIQHLFDNWQLRRIYFETLEFNFEQFEGLDSLVEIEGRLKDFEYFNGQWWDLLVGTITHERWANMRAQIRKRAVQVVPECDGDGPVSFDHFVGIIRGVSREAGREIEDTITFDARLVDDLGLDSLDLLVLLDTIEQESGTRLGNEDLHGLATVRDWHNLFLTASQRPQASK